MHWRIFFHCEPQQAEHLGTALEEHALAVSWFESKNPDVWIVEAITMEEPNKDDFIALLTPICKLMSLDTPTLNIEALPETDWLEATWRSFPPQQIGRYYVYGSHTSPSPPPSSVTLEINAATAFGSGEHETTTGCLLTLDALATEGRTFQKPLDMGCGSGILAMAIAKTWTVPVIAADNDPECIRVTENNADLNQCAHLITPILSEGFSSQDIISRGPYDLIVANILAGPLMEMAKDLAQCLAPGGMVILSGLLSRHRENMIKAYEAEGLFSVSHRTINDWEALLLEKR